MPKFNLGQNVIFSSIFLTFALPGLTFISEKWAYKIVSRILGKLGNIYCVPRFLGMVGGKPRCFW